MRSYRTAIVGNGSIFEGATVLDVGAGSGILSLWAAQAGAKKVYAVEFTDMAKHARTLVKKNGFDDIVDVRQCAVEAMGLQKEVDIIISEWMGYFLLRESMLDSVLYARDHYLKENGTILPNSAQLYWAPARLDDERDTRLKDRADAMADFDAFAHQMHSDHQLDFHCIRGAYAKEQTEYYIKQAQWLECDPDNLLAEPALVKSFNLYTMSLDDARGVDKASFNFHNVPLNTVSAFLGWFSVDFDTDGHGRPLPTIVDLDTHPKAGYSHWGQQAFFTSPDLDHDLFASTSGDFSMVRQSNAVRLYTIKCDLHDGDQSKSLAWELS